MMRYLLAAAMPFAPSMARAPLDDAMALIHADPARAAAAYLALAREKVDTAEATEIIRELNDRFESTPRGIFAIATFMHGVGMIKVAPTGWQAQSSPHFYPIVPMG
jgi:hypothetical protein